MRETLRIVVTGLAGTYPFGGVFWDYVQYSLGMQRLGHEVLYIEDTGKWCYDPSAATFVESGASNAKYLAHALKQLDAEQNSTLAERWFMRDATGETFGRSWQEVVDFCRSADLFLHISASCCMREEYLAVRRKVFIDSDPIYTQAFVPSYLDGTIDDETRVRVDMLRQHDFFFTFGEKIGQADCRVPTGLFDWVPTRQPVVLDCFRNFGVPVDERRRVLTTVASWEPTEKGPVLDGIAYAGKSIEFERFLDLPLRSTLPLEVALSGPAPYERIQRHGWALRDGYEISRDPWIYRDYLAHSMGELSVAKNAYVASRSGWFSCRTACYLALGVPAVIQDTGFSESIPTGHGLFSFSNIDEATRAIETIESDYNYHQQAAHEVALTYFDSKLVLGKLLQHIGLG